MTRRHPFQPKGPASLAAPAWALPFEVAADLRRLAARLGESPSLVAERFLAAYLDVLDTTLGHGGIGAWLDRLFEAEHAAEPRVRMRLALPEWEILAVRAYAAIEDAREEVVLAAMLGRTLKAALAETEAAAGEPVFDRTIGDLLVEHRPAA